MLEWPKLFAAKPLKLRVGNRLFRGSPFVRRLVDGGDRPCIAESNVCGRGIRSGPLRYQRLCLRYNHPACILQLSRRVQSLTNRIMPDARLASVGKNPGNAGKE